MLCGVRAPGPAVRALGRSLRAAAVVSPVRRAVPRPGHLQPGGHSALSRLRSRGQGPFAGPGCPLSAELVLSVGTTLGVAALLAVAVRPTWRLHLTFRPGLRFPRGWRAGPAAWRWSGFSSSSPIDLSRSFPSSWPTGGEDRRDRHLQLRLAGVQLGGRGAGAVRRGQRVPGAVRREGQEFDRTCAGSTRGGPAVSWLGTAVIAAIAVPAAHVLARQPDQVPELIEAFVLFAPGLAGSRSSRTCRG